MLSKHRNQSIKHVKCAIITVSDTRDETTDKSGRLIQEMLKENSHHIEFYKVIPDDKDRIIDAVKEASVHPTTQAIVVNGGTGIARRDVTIESIQPMFEKELPGFGEIFRYLSYQLDIGSASILSRATSGIINDKIIFSIPGSTGAVRLALEKLILPEIGHIVMEINKDLNN